MAKIRERKMTLYPLILNLNNNVNLTSKEIADCLKSERILINMKRLGTKLIDNLYSIVVDHYENGLLKGRLLKLRQDPLEKVIDDKVKKEIIEKILATPENEYLEESVLFVWNIYEGIMFAQFNPDTVNVLHSKPFALINNAVFICKRVLLLNELHPLPSKEFIKEIVEKKGGIKKYVLKFGDINLKYLEDAGIKSDLWEIAEQNNFSLDLILKPQGNLRLNIGLFNMLEKFADKFSNKAKNLTVNTEIGNFDLIGEKLIFFTIHYNFDPMNPEKMRSDLFFKIEEALNNNISNIKAVISGNGNIRIDKKEIKSLDDFNFL